MPLHPGRFLISCGAWCSPATNLTRAFQQATRRQFVQHCLSKRPHSSLRAVRQIRGVQVQFSCFSGKVTGQVIHSVMVNENCPGVQPGQRREKGFQVQS